MASRAIDGDAIPGGRRALAMAVRRASGSRVSSLALRPGHELCPSRPRSLAPSREARSWSGAESALNHGHGEPDFSLFGRWWSSAFRLTTPIFVARGPALLFGISRWLSQHGISRKRRNNLTRVLTSRTDRGRAIDTRVQSELVSSIVPRGTSLRWIVVLSLRQFGVRRSDCRRHFPCPAELGSITPHAMHNHGEPSG